MLHRIAPSTDNLTPYYTTQRCKIVPEPNVRSISQFLFQNHLDILDFFETTSFSSLFHHEAFHRILLPRRPRLPGQRRRPTVLLLDM
jgi:hypothetical protein